MVLLLPMTLIGLGLLVLRTGYLSLEFAQETVFTAYRRAIQGLMSSLLFTYFPFLATPPIIYQENASTLQLLKWQRMVSALWFLGFEIALPIVDVVTDVMFTVELQTLRVMDPFTEGDRILDI